MRAAAVAAVLLCIAVAVGADPPTPKRSRRKRHFCEVRKGCDDCTADVNCLWCSSPRQCLDSTLSTEQLNASCPVQAPRSVCVDFNLEKEREGFVRPCTRRPGGSIPAAEMPRSCCGDGVCDVPDAAQSAWWAAGDYQPGVLAVLAEDEQNCPADCSGTRAEAVPADVAVPKKLIETKESSTVLFGTLLQEPVVHDTYHCEDTFDEGSDGAVTSICSPKSQAHRPSQWLEELVIRDATLLRERSTPEQVETFNAYRQHTNERRAKKRHLYGSMVRAGGGFSGCKADLSCEPEVYPPLPFAMPAFGSRVLEFGAGLGQDTRNLADAGYRVLGVEVSGEAAGEAKSITAKSAPWLSDDAKARFELVNYDALALPKPLELVDMVVDMTVYCGLRHRYLSRLYALWERVLTPGHTIMMISCWKGDDDGTGDGIPPPVPIYREDMVMDFAPMFETLHTESCMKNQERGGPDGAWCFWLRLKPAEERAGSQAGKGEL